MRSRIVGRSYEVLLPDDKFSVKVNKKTLDGALSSIQKSCEQIAEVLEELYERDYDAYRLLRDEVFSGASLSLSDGECWNISYLGSLCSETLLNLNHSDDEIPSEEDIVTLSDLGYQSHCSRRFWEKVIENTDEREVVDEVQWTADGTVYHRLRTTIWEKVPGGKHSKSILYRKLRTGKKLEAAIKNTMSGKEWGD